MRHAKLFVLCLVGQAFLQVLFCATWLPPLTLRHWLGSTVISAVLYWAGMEVLVRWKS